MAPAVSRESIRLAATRLWLESQQTVENPWQPDEAAQSSPRLPFPVPGWITTASQPEAAPGICAEGTTHLAISAPAFFGKASEYLC
jgi:hypothetical protein